MNKINQLLFLFLFLSASGYSQIDYELFSKDATAYDYVSGEHAMWVATDGGLVRIDHITDEVSHYNPVNSGFEGIRVVDLVIDKDNVKWITTNYGLYSFDDLRWRKIDLPFEGELLLWNLRVSEEGTIWFIRTIDLSIFDGLGQELYSYKEGELKNYNSFFGENVAFFELSSDEQIYVGSKTDVLGDRFLYSFDGQIARELEDDFSLNRRGTTIDENGNLLIAHSITFTDYERVRINRIGNDSSEILYEDYYPSNAYSFQKDKDGNLWFPVGREFDIPSFIKISGSGTEIENISYEDLGIDLQDISNDYSLVAFDQNDNMWLRNPRNLVNTYKLNSNNVTSYNTHLSTIESNSFNYEIEEDCEGNIYILLLYGISKYDGANWSTFRFEENGMGNLQSDSGSDAALNPITCELWFNTNFSNGEILTVKDGVYNFRDTDYEIRQIEFDDEGTAYLSTGIGLVLIDTNNVETVIEDSPSCYNMAVGKDKEVWMHCSDLHQLKDGVWTTYKQEEHPFGDGARLPLLLDHENHLWTFYDDGLVKFDGQDWDLIPFDFGSYYPRALEMDQNNNLLIGSVKKGMFRYNGLTFETFDVYSAPLGHNTVKSIHVGKNGNNWLITSRGVLRMRERFSDAKNKIGGIAFYDHSQNGIFDPAEDVRLANQRIIHRANDEVSYTNSAGGYAFGLFNASVSSVENTPDEDWQPVTPSMLDYNFTGTDITNLDFALFNDDLESDMSVDLVSSQLICNGITRYWITVKNLGIEQQSGTVRFNFEDAFNFVGANFSPEQINATTLEWDFEDLRYTETKVFKVNLSTPDENLLGEFFTANVTLQSEDLQINKEKSLEEELLCSYDPNDKLSRSTGQFIDSLSLIEDALEYTIRFQNLGNYPAKKVVLIDTLDHNLDVSSLEIVSYSHEVATTIVDGNVVIFNFDDINLPFADADEEGSNGFVKFKIKAKEDIQSETAIYNSATIYFDFNAGIKTNTTENILLEQLPVSNKNIIERKQLYELYPNPSSSEFILDEIEKSSTSSLISVYDINGSLVSRFTADTYPVFIQVEHAGMYFATIRNETGLYSFKLVKTD